MKHWIATNIGKNIFYTLWTVWLMKNLRIDFLKWFQHQKIKFLLTCRTWIPFSQHMSRGKEKERWEDGISEARCNRGTSLTNAKLFLGQVKLQCHQRGTYIGIGTGCFGLSFYRPQRRTCGNVMFLHLSVILFTGVCLPLVRGGRHPPGQIPQHAVHAGRYGQQAAVHILLECILVPQKSALKWKKMDWQGAVHPWGSLP